MAQSRPTDITPQQLGQRSESGEQRCTWHALPVRISCWPSGNDCPCIGRPTLPSAAAPLLPPLCCLPSAASPLLTLKEVKASLAISKFATSTLSKNSISAGPSITYLDTCGRAGRGGGRSGWEARLGARGSAWMPQGELCGKGKYISWRCWDMLAAAEGRCLAADGAATVRCTSCYCMLHEHSWPTAGGLPWGGLPTAAVRPALHCAPPGLLLLHG